MASRGPRGGRADVADPRLPQDRLQPALLDRLTDEQPDRKSEAREARVISRRRLRESVLRDMTWLFNATRMDDGGQLAALPRVRDSVVNYGLPALSGQLASSLDVQDLTGRLRHAIQVFEPRILPDSLQITALTEAGSLEHHNVLAVQIHGQLWGQPTPVEFLVRTDIDLETGKVRITDMNAPLREA